MSKKPQFTKDEIRWLFILVNSQRWAKDAIDTRAYEKMCTTVLKKLEGMYK